VTKILITHWHGDHVLGLPGLLSTLALSGYRKELLIYGPKGTKEFMRELLKVFGFKRDYKIKVEEVFPKGMTPKGASVKFFDDGDFYLEAKSMQHGIPTNAYNFVKKGLMRIDKSKLKKSKLPFGPLLQKLKRGKDVKYKGKKYLAKNLTYQEGDKKISFVLDTKRNERIAPFVKGSDVLISESSYGQDLVDKASEHLHMTSKQAAEVAKKSKVKKLVLTHISQRYEKNPKKILNEAKKVFKNSVLAKDFDSFSV
jgi:ribonuclease Z